MPPEHHCKIIGIAHLTIERGQTYGKTPNYANIWRDNKRKRASDPTKVGAEARCMSYAIEAEWPRL